MESSVMLGSISFWFIQPLFGGSACATGVTG